MCIGPNVYRTLDAQAMIRANVIVVGRAVGARVAGGNLMRPEIRDLQSGNKVGIGYPDEYSADLHFRAPASDEFGGSPFLG
jgi:hypothetical protein